MTFNNLPHRSFNAPAYQTFRGPPLAEVAASLAAAGRLDAIAVIIQRHPYTTSSVDFLQALNAAPDALAPDAFVPIFKAVKEPLPPMPVHKDWAESRAILHHLADTSLPLPETEYLSASNSDQKTLTDIDIAQWFCQRALAVDSACGQLPLAIRYLHLGIDIVKNRDEQRILTDTLVAARQLSILINLALEQDNMAEAMDFSLEEYVSLSQQQRLSRAFALLPEGDTLESQLIQHISPFLEDMDMRDALVRHEILEESQRRLPWVIHLLKLQVNRPTLFTSQEELYNTAVECIYSEAAAFVDHQQSLGEPHWLDEMLIIARGTSQGSALLQQRLGTVKGHIDASNAFIRQGLVTTPAVIRSADKDAALQMIQTMLGRAARSRGGKKESLWAELWNDVDIIHHGGFDAFFTVEDMRIEFLTVMLRAGQFSIAPSHLALLENEIAEVLVNTAARSILASEVMLTPSVERRVKHCLALLPPKSSVAMQLMKIVKVLSQLQSLGISLPPMRLLEDENGDEGALLEEILNTHPELSSDVDSMAEVADILGISDERGGLLSRAVEASLANGDVSTAQILALQIVELQYSPGWELVARVALDSRCKEMHAKSKLLAFAAIHCPDKHTLELLNAWEHCDAQLHGTTSCWMVPDVDTLQDDTMMSSPARETLSAYFNEAISSKKRDASDAMSLEVLSAMRALGQDGFSLWDALMDNRAEALSYQAHRHALTLALTAASLLALRHYQVEGEDVSFLLQSTPMQLEEKVFGNEEALHSDFGVLVAHYRQQITDLDDTARLNELLPGTSAVHTTGTNKREAVLQLAEAAGKPDAQGHLEPSRVQSMLSNALDLAPRYDIKPLEVYKTFIHSILLNNLECKEPEMLKASAGDVIDTLIECHPDDLLSLLFDHGILHRVIATDNILHTLLCLSIAEDCCIAQSKHRSDGAKWNAIGEALQGLQHGLHSLYVVEPSSASGILIQPHIGLLSKIFGGSECVTEDSDSSIIGHIASIATHQNFQGLSESVEVFDECYQALERILVGHAVSSYVASPNDVYAAALCNEVSTSDIASQEAFIRLILSELSTPSLIHISFWSALGRSLDEELGDSKVVRMLEDRAQPTLPEVAKYVLLQLVLEELCTRSDAPPMKGLILRRAYNALAAMRTVVQNASLTEEHLSMTQSVLVILSEHGAEGRGFDHIESCLETLLISGCSLTDIATVATAFAAVDPSYVQSTQQLVEHACQRTIDESLSAISGTATHALSYSIGDAVQNLYGILRSLDADSAKDDEMVGTFTLFDSTRILVWQSLRRYAAEFSGKTVDVATAEAQLQVLEMLGMLGSTMWSGWSPPPGKEAMINSDDADDETKTISQFRHTEAVLFARMVSVMSSAGWPTAAQEAQLESSDLNSPESIESALIRLLEASRQDKRKLHSIILILQDVFYDLPAERCWLLCLSMCLEAHDLEMVIHSLDKSRQMLSIESTGKLMAVAAGRQGAASTVAIAGLAGYPELCCWHTLWDNFSAELPGIETALILALLNDQIAEFATENLKLFEKVVKVLMSGAERSLAAALLAAQLALRRAYVAAAFVAMEHAHVHPMLRVLDSSIRVLRDFLKAGSDFQIEGEGVSRLQTTLADEVITQCSQALNGLPHG